MLSLRGDNSHFSGNLLGECYRDYAVKTQILPSIMQFTGDLIITLLKCS